MQFIRFQKLKKSLFCGFLLIFSVLYNDIFLLLCRVRTLFYVRFA